jgi:hypothetical protein
MSVERIRWCGLLVAGAVLLPLFAQAQGKSLVERLGYPPEAKLLIVHADDVGMAHSINTATIEAMTRGWVSSAGLMAPCPAFAEAAALARANPSLDFGIHLTLNSEWRSWSWGPVSPLSRVRSLVDRDGFFLRSYIETLGYASAEEVETEIRAQIQRALDAGVRPTHIDSHMGILFMRPSYFDAYRKVAHEFRLPYLLPQPTYDLLRMFDPRRRVSTYGLFREIEASGDVMIDHLIMGIDAAVERRTDAYLEVIEKLKPGVTELIIHCGEDSDELRGIMGSWPYRVADKRAFLNPAVKKALDDAGVRLIGWGAIKALQYGE